jgi:hypothetical protein
MKRLLAVSCMLALLGGVTTLTALQSSAAPKKGPTVKVKAQKGEARGVQIKNEHETNNPGAKIKPPAAKGGPKTRGGVGTLHVDNRTQWYIRIYNNGDYIGTVGPYGDLYRYAEAGNHVLYARAPMEDGDDLHWGSTTLRVYDDETSTWTLYN